MMLNRNRQIILILIIACIKFSVKAQTSSKDDLTSSDFYTAAVVEFKPAEVTEPSTAIVEEQLHAYLHIIRTTSTSDVDIIIFPENTLNNVLLPTYVPNSVTETIPCNDTTGRYADFLQQLSCAASETRQYVVINLTEKEDCPAVGDRRPCAPNGLNIYNTNVVFDRMGRVISRYRKINLYLEAPNTTATPEFGIFDTDFGVKFGHFTCFDILFYRPALELVEQYKVSDLIMTTFFYSELPFLTAVQLQESWAWGNNVNLLAAGASNPKVGATGSGIYAGSNGTLISVMAHTNIKAPQVLVAKVPKISSRMSQLTKNNATPKPTPATLKPTPKPTSATPKPIPATLKPIPKPTQSTLKLLRDPVIDNFQSILLDGKKRQENYTLCHKEHCCHFEIDIGWQQPIERTYRFRIGAFSGQRTYGMPVWSHIKVCALYSCLNESIESCGEPIDLDEYQQPTFFIYSINIRSDFEKQSQMLIMPTNLDTNLYTLQTKFVQWQKLEEGNHVSVNYNLRDYSNGLQTFGIYANYYDGSAAASRFEIFWLTFMGVAGILLVQRIFSSID